jgi:peroxiredoxin Q/BCP
MKLLGMLLLLFAGAVLLVRIVQAREQPEAGQAAPDFLLADQQGRQHRLQDYHGQWLVLYFYPKDDTPGCTREACAFRDGYRELRALDAQVIGVSLDDRASHAEFAQKYQLPFPLLADEKGDTARAYGVLWSLGPIRFTRRHTFIIDPDGKIAQVYRKVDADRHAEEVVRDLQEMMPVRMNSERHR